MILPSIAVVSSIFAGCAVAYSKIRPRFPVKVNCWFCQNDFIVPYHERNSWDCPHCEQYNGFNESGDYNKFIEEQYNSELNPEISAQRGTRFNITNKLCSSCTVNQQLKIQQLASFSPRNNDKFDEEEKKYRLHLERVYQLCRMCDKYVKTKLMQDERKYKSNLLAWKLESSKKHFQTDRTIRSIYRNSNHYLTHIGFLFMWLNLIPHLNHFCVLTNNGDYLPEYWVSLSYVDWIPQVASVVGIFCALSNFYFKCWDLKKSYVHIWSLLCTLMWSMILLPSQYLHMAHLEKLSISVMLCLLGFLKMAPVLLKRRLKPRLKMTELKMESTQLNDTRPKSPSKCNPQASDLDIGKLDISTSPGQRRQSPKSSFSHSPSFIRPKPVLSPSRFNPSNISCSNGNLTKASWVAGGYWQSNNWNSPSFTPLPPHSPNHSFALSRSSSQSSGIGSIQTGLYNRSPSDSRPGSAVGEIDRLSVFSDHLESRFPDSNQHVFQENSSPIYQSNSALSQRAFSSSSTSLISAQPSHWSWMPFMLGFSLAVNICVLVYFVFIHSARVL